MEEIISKTRKSKKKKIITVLRRIPPLSEYPNPEDFRFQFLLLTYDNDVPRLFN